MSQIFVERARVLVEKKELKYSLKKLKFCFERGQILVDRRAKILVDNEVKVLSKKGEILVKKELLKKDIWRKAETPVEIWLKSSL